MELHREHTLATYLRACGHFLYYQTGGKTGQQRILTTLLKMGNVTQKDLQATLEISSGALSEILQKMEDSGLVIRKKSCDDKRQSIIELTSAGKELAIQMKIHYTNILNQMFTCLDEQDKTTLIEILEKLVVHLDTLKSNPQFGQNMCMDDKKIN